MRVCRLIGQECLRQTCDQYNPVTGVCKFDRQISKVMYQPMDLFSLSNFIKYLEGVRPSERTKDEM